MYGNLNNKTNLAEIIQHFYESQNELEKERLKAIDDENNPAEDEPDVEDEDDDLIESDGNITRFKALIGHTMSAVYRKGDEELFFAREDGRKFRFYHMQSCCEKVYIEDICGDLSDLIGSPILVAELVTSEKGPEKEYSNDSHTWSFYKFSTVKGSVTVRWLGESNGFYSEEVDFG